MMHTFKNSLIIYAKNCVTASSFVVLRMGHGISTGIKKYLSSLQKKSFLAIISKKGER